MNQILQEIVPITEDDLFIIFNRPNAKFSYPIHSHPEYEINLVMNTSGTRVIGDNEEEFNGLDLVMTGPNLPHVWKDQPRDYHTVLERPAGRPDSKQEGIHAHQAASDRLDPGSAFLWF